MNRPVDYFYFALLVVACVFGYIVSMNDPEPVEMPEMAGFETLDLPIEEPDFLLFSMPVFKERELPKLHLSHHMETVLSEVRDKLLKTSIPSQTIPSRPLPSRATPSPSRETERLASRE